MRALVIFLIRKRLGLRKYETFQFTNQKTSDVYYFTKTHLYKVQNNKNKASGASLNWLLSPDCHIRKENDNK